MCARILRPLLLLLSFLTASAAIAEHWSERPLHEDVPQPTGNGFAHAVGSDGRNFLVGSERYAASTEAPFIMHFAATLMDSSGTVLREASLPFIPWRITWSGRLYLVFGERQYAAVSADGVHQWTRNYPAGVEARDLFFGVDNGVPGASNGRRSLIVLSRNAPPLTYIAVLFDADGEVVGEIVAPFEPSARGVQVASDGNVFAMTWYTRTVTPNGGIPSDTRYLAIYDETGKAIDANIRISTDVIGDADLVSDGHTFGVFPTGNQQPHPSSIYRPDGTLVRRLTIPAQAGGELDPSDAFPIGTSGYFVNGNGRNGSEGAFLPWPSYEPESAGLGTGVALGYATAAAAGRTILIDYTRAFIFSSKDDAVTNAFTNRIPIFYIKPEQTGGSAAVNANGTALVVWSEGAYEQPGRLYAIRVTSTGVPLDHDPIDVGAVCYATRPAVSSDGRDFLVSWRSCTSVFAARVSSRGAVLDPIPLTLASASVDMRPSIAFDGTNYVVAWQTESGISVSRVSPGGSLLDQPARTFEGTWPLLAPAQDGVLLAYRRRSGAVQSGHIVSQRLGRDLMAIGTTATVSANWNDIQPAWLERAGDRYLLTYSVALDEFSRQIHAAQWLNANGEHIRHGAGTLFPTVSTAEYFRTALFPQIRANCTGRDCTLAWTAEGGHIRTAPMLDESPGTPTTAASGVYPRPILFTGTSAEPRMLIYARAEGQSYRIFIRSAAHSRRRAVGQ